MDSEMAGEDRGGSPCVALPVHGRTGDALDSTGSESIDTGSPNSRSEMCWRNKETKPQP